MKSSWITFTISLIIIVVAVVVATSVSKKPSVYTAFAQCTAEQGATFYGAFWCPHCIDQKRSFGNAEQFLNYIECSTPDRAGQTEVCTEAGIQSYPTWEFANGQRLTGALELEVIAAMTGCELPEEHEPTVEIQFEDADGNPIDMAQFNSESSAINGEEATEVATE